ncbi:MAG: NADH-quinone oxidoreductase subunit NuoG [Proteobacteria bacterium]|jgi:NADH-quinone oxidoreductase subunit G|nr:NADH-quinone oxidoreductase subunit NuoG [Pseudomonadota bacterium]
MTQNVESNTVKITINGLEHDIPKGLTVLQACRDIAGVEIPHFCYHDRLSIAGNCRMCLVDIKPGPPKPQASCAINVAEGMIVETKNEMTQTARKNVMQFLLANHPLDCPICDQGGECDLQDQSIKYGSAVSNFSENKRAVDEKSMGPLIKTAMTRCIHCMRCVRFMEEVAGTSELGSFNRGNETEVATFLGKNITSELSGNIIDLCPVGALTAKPYAFTYRSWELSKTPSIDVMDSLGSAIRVDTKANKVVRILPRINEEINEEWISDRTRFSCDGLSVQRIDRPYIKKDGQFIRSTWEEALLLVAQKLTESGEKACAIAGKFTDAESLFAVKKLFNALHSRFTEINEDGARIITNDRKNYLLNTPIAQFENLKTLLIVNCDVRNDAPLLNARILKGIKNGLKVFVVGNQFNANYKYTHLGLEKSILDDILAGQHPQLFVENSALLLGRKALAHEDAHHIHNICLQIAQKMGQNAFNLLHNSASAVAGLDLGFSTDGGIKEIYDNIYKQNIKFTFLLGADDINFDALKKTFVVYQGTHADKAVRYADIILPAEAYTEKFATYTNNEGKIQVTTKAVESPLEATNDSEIIRMIAKKCRISIPEFAYTNTQTAVNVVQNSFTSNQFAEFSNEVYCKCSISRNSKTMLECEKQLVG